MATITLKGQPVRTAGELPAPGRQAPDFTLTANDLSEKHLRDYLGKTIILNIFPSLDTSTCAMSVRRFNQEAGSLPRAVVLCVSMDLPFAQARFCGAEGLENVVTLSGFRNPSFGKDYGVSMVDGPLAGLYSRAVLVLDAKGKVVYRQQVPEIAQEPDYPSALKAAREA